VIWLIFFIIMGVLGRMAGNGFGSKWNLAYLPEMIYSLPYGFALGWALYQFDLGFAQCISGFFVGSLISYGGMQAATWSFLRWESHSDPNLNRTSDLKFIVDWLASLFNYKLGDEGYSWISAGVKGFIIGLPVGGVFTAVLWALGYEIGSHARGRVERFGIDPHAISEIASAFLGAVSILAFVTVITLIV
jgi:hypothetical protein